jgi:hypothetical protein
MENLQLITQKLLLIPILTFILAFNGFAQEDGGVCMKGDCINGYGEMAWENGQRYEGYFKNGLREGYGYMRYSTGNIYIGEWEENTQHGHGMLSFHEHPTQKKFVGEWKRNVREGYGTLYQSDGTFKVGFWRKNQFVAEAEKEQCLEGNCENGWGTYAYNDYSLYIGEFKDKKRHGQGTLIYKLGTKYKGSHVNDLREGFGVYYYAGGNKYVGDWKENKKFGQGEMYSNGKLIYSANWSDNVPSDKVYPEDAPENPVGFVGKNSTDKAGPSIEILSPAVKRGPIVVAKQKKVRVHGVAKDDSEIVKVRVNGVNAALSQTSAKTRDFEVLIDVAQGQTDFWVDARDVHGNVTKIDFTVVFDGEEDTNARDYDNALSDKEAPRMALIIGNSNYDNVPLRNPVNDATAIATKLQDYNFDVTLRLNINQDDLVKAIRSFGQKLKDTGGIGLFYYAGHGLQIKGENYLVPVDAEIEKELDVEMEAVKLQRVLNEFDYASNQMNIVILDACRDNPYANLRSLGSGLAPISRAPLGTFIAYATSPGQAASDGENNHGLYTQELLNALNNVENKQLEDVFKEVRSNVRKKSEGEQIPWENSSLEGTFYFKRKDD